jgi:SAM-dependent methyltransferase
MSNVNIKPGDFTGLATDYSQYRPDYSTSVLNGMIGLLEKPLKNIDFVDVGAGTGIWTRMVHNRGVNSTIAIEPNEDMLSNGKADSKDLTINWISGTAEQTGLSDHSCDWLTMASSFHWANFDVAMKEFQRVIRPGGRLSVLWNPRLIEVNPLLVEIEAHLDLIQPNIKRVSSGRSGITEGLSERFWNCPFFEDIVYLEGRHSINMSKARYIGAWRSVNDLRVQLGKEGFDAFLSFVEQKLSKFDFIETTYLTRAWSVRRKN